MAENLKVTRYRNGDEIPEVKGKREWKDLETGARCVYDNDEDNADTYGYLYNWYAAVDKRNIAPEGWRVPSDEDWKALEMALGMSRPALDNIGWRGSPAGSRLAGNADLWESDDLTNHSEFGTSGFSALPAGYCFYVGDFDYLGAAAHFWSVTESGEGGAWGRDLNCGLSGVGRSSYEKPYGLSVRLVRD